MASFVSSRDLDTKRAEKRKARQTLLDEEKSKFLAKERVREKHRESGNDKWILPGIEKRIEKDASKVVLLGKKHKKQKKKKKRRKKSSDSAESDSEEECWEEKSSSKEIPTYKPTENMMSFDDLISGNQVYTSESVKEKQKEEKANQISKNREEELIGQHPKELNPYWKDGGEGLPPEKSEKRTSNFKQNKISKDWLLKSLKRMNEQAEDEGRTIQSIAAERYGSWTEFQHLLRETEPQNKKERSRERGRRKDLSSKPGKNAFMRPEDENSDEDRDQRHSRDRHRKHHKERDHRRSHDSNQRSSRKGDDRYRPSWKKPRSDKVTESEENTEHHRSRNKDSESNDDSMDRHLSHKPINTSLNNSGANDNRQNRQVSPEYRPSMPQAVKKTATSVIAKKIEKPTIAILSEKEKNQLAAKILKAELMGNDKLAKTLKLKLENARQAESVIKETTETSVNKEESGSGSSEEEVVLTRSGKDGQTWPVQHSDLSYDSVPNKKRKKKKVPTHKSGERERYFADDDRHSLQDLVRREKMDEAEDQDAMFSRLASKQFRATDSDDFTLDDMYVSQASQQTTRTEEEARQKQKAISDHKKLAKRLEKCRLCFGNPELPKHLLIAIGKKSYLCLPEHKPLSLGHCFIVPMHHCSSGTGVDEDVWEEIKLFMQSLQGMFRTQDMDCIFMQTCIGLKRSRHFFVDCVPMPIEEGEMAPIYFKKAIQESESEWSHNKKLIDTRGKDARNCIPKGLPYFTVDFGLDGGFAHVVEDETLFPHFFGREVVGGMLDVEPRLWRHPPKDHFTEQTKRSLQFSEWWKPHDWTADVSSTS